MEAYYYSKMNRPQQAVYQSLLRGLSGLSDSVQVPACPGEELHQIFFRLRLDHPEIFWAPSFRFRSHPASPYLTVVPEYLFEKGKIRDHQKAMEARVKKLIRPALELSEWDKEKYVHDFICENVRYDKLKKAYSHEIIGPLGQGTGVCEGIAKTVKLLCQALGLECMIAVCGSNPEKGIKYLHTWNLVKIRGMYYHLDATFDCTLGSRLFDGRIVRYDYFNLSDRQIFRDHEPLIAPAPECTDGAHFYYREKKLSFTKTEEVYKRAVQSAAKGKTLLFHWRGGYLTDAVLAELLDLMRQAGRQKDKVPAVSVNRAQAVICLTYLSAEKEREARVELEEANEGEREETV